MENAPNVEKLQKELESSMNDIYQKQLIPRQKDAFLCSARCCDSTQDMGELQKCVDRCSSIVAASQQAMGQHLSQFQERFGRCSSRCEDVARDSLPSQPSQADMKKAEDKFSGCINDCAKEALGRLPRLKSDVQEQLQRL